MGAGFGICRGFREMLLAVLGSGRALTGLFLNCVPEWGGTRLADWDRMYQEGEICHFWKL